MNINILRYSLFGIAGGQEVDRNFLKFNYFYNGKYFIYDAKRFQPLGLLSKSYMYTFHLKKQ